MYMLVACSQIGEIIIRIGIKRLGGGGVLGAGKEEGQGKYRFNNAGDIAFIASRFVLANHTPPPPPPHTHTHTAGLFFLYSVKIFTDFYVGVLSFSVASNT